MDFPSDKHEEAYNFYTVYFANQPDVVHVSGNGMELVVYRTVHGPSYGDPTGAEAVLVSVFVYEEGLYDMILVKEQERLLVTPQRAPLFYAALDPIHFDAQINEIHHQSAPKDSVSERFVRYAENECTQNQEALRAYSFNVNTMVSTYNVPKLDSLTIITRGYDQTYAPYNGTGIIALEAFNAGVERSKLIRESLVAYYGTEGVESA